MLKKLDELEEHPMFYERSQEDVHWATEAKAKSTDNFDEVLTIKIRFSPATDPWKLTTVFVTIAINENV